MFADATPATDGQSMCTGEILCSTNSTTSSMYLIGTFIDVDLGGQGSRSMATQATAATRNESASPTLPRRSEKLSQSLERYSPRVFFIDSGEPTNHQEA